MSDRQPLYKSRLVRGVAAGTGAAMAAGWATQHRLVARTHAAPDEIASEGLTVPDDCTEHLVDTDDGGAIHVVERGQGPPVVLLHGFMLSSALWAHQLRDLAVHHRVIAPDLRGHGSSVTGRDGFSVHEDAGRVDELRAEARMALSHQGSPALRRMALDVRTVLDALDVEHALVVGHSMGGMVALQLAHDTPEPEMRRVVAGLALVSTTGGPFGHLPGYSAAARLAGPVSARAMGLADRWGVRTLASQDVRWWLTRLGFGAEAPPAQVRFVEGLHLATAPSTVAALLPALALFDLSTWLGHLERPVLVVVGSRDRLTPPRHAQRTAAALPHSELVELPRCGHMPMIERRFEFARLIEEFAAKID
jgi:non-heme chloroperoxidase